MAKNSRPRTCIFWEKKLFIKKGIDRKSLRYHKNRYYIPITMNLLYGENLYNNNISQEDKDRWKSPKFSSFRHNCFRKLFSKTFHFLFFMSIYKRNLTPFSIFSLSWNFFNTTFSTPKNIIYIYINFIICRIFSLDSSSTFILFHYM